MKLYAKSLFFLSILIFIFIFYKSEIYWKSNRFDYYLKYYIISISFLVFFSVLFFIKNIYRTYFLISFTALVFSLYSFELYITTDFSTKNSENVISIKKNLLKENYNKIYDERSLEELYIDEKKNETNTVLAVYPSTYLFNNYLEKKNVNFFPLSGIAGKKTLVCNESGYYSNYFSDRYGFNNPNYEWDNKKIDYFLLGDSFVHGSCVNRPYDIGSVLRKLTKKNVLNLGYGGNGPLMQLAALKEYTKNIDIKNVLWFFYESNDMINLSQELKNKHLKNYLENSSYENNLRDKQLEIDEVANFNLEESFKTQKKTISNKKFFKEKIINFIKLSQTRKIIFDNKVNTMNYDFNEFDQILKEAINHSNFIGANFYMIYLPSFDRYSKNSSELSIIKKKLENIIKLQNINYIDIHSELFKKVGNPLMFFPFELDGHYNKNGYLKIGEIIKDKVK